jgi:hypothetical protein
MSNAPTRQAASIDMAAGFRPRAVALLFVALMAVAIIPVLTHRLPPLSDYVNHLARVHVINEIGEDANLSRFYSIDWAIIPNLMIDLVVPWLSEIMNVYAAGQAFTVLSFLLIVSGTLALNRALFGRWSVLPLIAIPLLYNGVLLVGVMNYVFGIGLALWALAGWVMIRERRFVPRLALSTLFVVALFFCHLFAVGIYALGLLAFELQRLWEKRAEPLWPRLIDFVATGFPFLVVGPLILAGPTPNTPGFSADWEFWGKIHGLLLAVNVYYPLVAFALVAAVVLVGVYSVRREALNFHPFGWAVLAVGAIAYLAMPRVLLAAHLADQRLPIALAFILIACIDIQLRTRTARYAFVGILALVVTMRVIEVQAVWSGVSPRAEEFLKSVRMIERGKRILVVHGSGSGEDEITNNDLMHAASLATIERSALVTTAFTVPGKHILRARNPYNKIVDTQDNWPPSLPYVLAAAERNDPEQSFFWEFWPRNYDYVYILFTKRGLLCSDRKHLTLVHDGHGFKLYRVKRPG